MSVRNRGNASNQEQKLVREAIVRLFGLHLRSGASVRELRTFAKSCVSIVEQDFDANPLGAGLDINQLGKILRLWHRDARYLASDGTPRPLAMEGKEGLRQLVESCCPKQRANSVVDILRTSRLLKKSVGGLWIPTSKHARISMYSREILAHLAEGIARLVETVSRNMNSTTENEVLFERSAKVRHLPVTEAAAFRAYVQQQATVFITTIDDWMEARVEQAAKRSKNTTAAGIFTFAYMDYVPKKQIRKRKRRLEK